jgi:exodeoxyribonuclease VII large subunit
VVSAVGHEVDFSISDFVADIRAATPSAAAELLSPDQSELVSKLHLLKGRLANSQLRRINRWREQLLSLSRRVRDPRSQLREQSQRLDDLEIRLQRQWQQAQRQRKQRLIAVNQQLALLNPDRQLKTKQKELSTLRERLQHAMNQQLKQPRVALKNMEQQLKALGPEQTLNRGYAIVQNASGTIIRDSKQLAQGQLLSVKFHHGDAKLRVEP